MVCVHSRIIYILIKSNMNNSLLAKTTDVAVIKLRLRDKRNIVE